MEEEKIVMSISLSDEIISRFIGLYLMKIKIPEDIYEYVRINRNKPELSHLIMFFDTIFGAADENNEIVRKMAIDFIR